MPKLTWLSFILLLVAYITFGRYLHASEASQLVWSMAALAVIALAAAMTNLWQPAKSFALLGFQSDFGCLVMVFILASLAVLVLAWAYFFAYVLVIVAASLLVRIDALSLDLSTALTFFILVGIPLLGLGLSWLPSLATQGIG